MDVPLILIGYRSNGVQVPYRSNCTPPNTCPPHVKPGFSDRSLELLSISQRYVLLTTVAAVLMVAIIGNCATIVATLKSHRKMRPLFRTSLLSLACSDILTASFTSMVYFMQLSHKMILIWRLGEIMCVTIPFITTTAILANSITLVAIALDRYMAVVKVLKGAWEPTGVFCTACAVLVWGLAAGIASPMITSYFLLDVNIYITDPHNHTIGLGIGTGKMCVSEKADNSYYFIIVFCAVFLPLFIAFGWLNAMIAREIWQRRKPLGQRSRGSTKSVETSDKRTSETNDISPPPSSSTSSDDRIITTVPTTNDNHNASAMHTNEKITINTNANNTNTITVGRSARKQRQLRMFKVIVIIILIFLLCRMPTWIYLLIKLSVNLVSNIHWVLHYVFGIMSMINCAANPLMYTFLAETVEWGRAIAKFATTNWMSNVYGGHCFGRNGSAAGERVSHTAYDVKERYLHTIAK